MTTEKLEETWTNRDYPVLRDVVRRIDLGDGIANAEDVAETTGLTRREVEQAMAALGRRGLVQGSGGMGTAGWDHVMEVSGAAYLMTGLHPDGDDALSRLVDALRQAAEQTSDSDEKSRLRRAADALGGITRDVAAGVLTAVLTGGT